MNKGVIKLFLLVVILIVFLMQFSCAADVAVNVKTQTMISIDNSPFIQQYIWNPITNPFLQDVTPSVAVVKFLFFLLCTILVLAIFPLLPVLKTIDGMWYLKYPFAIIVGYLFVIFFNKFELMGIVTQYTATGFVLLFTLPLLILTFWSVELLQGTTGEHNIFNVLSYLLIWGVYICYALYKMISFIILNNNWGTYCWFLLAAIVYAILMIFVVRRWLPSFLESEEEARKHRALRDSISDVFSGKDFLATIGVRSSEQVPPIVPPPVTPPPITPPPIVPPPVIPPKPRQRTDFHVQHEGSGWDDVNDKFLGWVADMADPEKNPDSSKFYEDMHDKLSNGQKITQKDRNNLLAGFHGAMEKEALAKGNAEEAAKWKLHRENELSKDQLDSLYRDEPTKRFNPAGPAKQNSVPLDSQAKNGLKGKPAQPTKSPPINPSPQGGKKPVPAGTPKNTLEEDRRKAAEKKARIESTKNTGQPANGIPAIQFKTPGVTLVPFNIDGYLYNVSTCSNRPKVLVNIAGVNVPFYLSTGEAGKTDSTGNLLKRTWYPFFGLSPGDGWINKITGVYMEFFYRHLWGEKVAFLMETISNELALAYGTDYTKFNNDVDLVTADHNESSFEDKFISTLNSLISVVPPQQNSAGVVSKNAFQLGYEVSANYFGEELPFADSNEIFFMEIKKDIASGMESNRAWFIWLYYKKLFSSSQEERRSISAALNTYRNFSKFPEGFAESSFNQFKQELALH